MFSEEQGLPPEEGSMKSICVALALLACAPPALASAIEDDAHREDRERTQELNRRAAAAIARRDAVLPARRDAAGVDREGAYDADEADYRAARAQYERDLAHWRRRAAACRQGDWDACE
jgi:hypothetical protein